MRRREFIGLLAGAAAAWPLGALAQQPYRMRLVGAVSNIPEDDAAMKARFAAFRQELERLGWLQSRNVRIETRFGAVTPEQIHASAKELLALQPDEILECSSRRARAATSKSYDPDSIRSRLGPDRCRLDCQLGEAGKQSHGAPEL